MKNWKLVIALAVLSGAGIFFGQKVYHPHLSKVDPQSLDLQSNEKSPEQVAAESAAKNGMQQVDANGNPLPMAGQTTAQNHSNQAGQGANGGAAGGNASQSVPVPPKPESNCFVYEFQHKPEAKQKDIEDFMDYTNAFPIAHKNFNAKSLCVKVNSQPVAFKVATTKGQTEVIVGSVVGPESLIRVSYCIGAAMCKETCAQPQKRFMDDLVSDASADDEFGDSWGNSGEQKKKLRAKVKAFRSVAKENDSLTKQSVMRDWKSVGHQESVCKKEGK